PGDVPTPPHASTVNPSTPIAHNFWAVGVPTSGQFAGTIAVYSTNRLDVVADVVGFYAPADTTGVAARAATSRPGHLRFRRPTRVLDARDEAGGPIGFDQNGAPVAAGTLSAGGTRRFMLADKRFGSTTFPSDLSGILAHFTIVQPAASGGFVTLFPGDAASPP